MKAVSRLLAAVAVLTRLAGEAARALLGRGRGRGSEPAAPPGVDGRPDPRLGSRPRRVGAGAEDDPATDVLIPPGQPDPSSYVLPRDPRAELLTAVALLASGAGGVAFVIAYVASANTQLLGLTGGIALLALAAALILAGAAVAPQETAVEPRPGLESDAAEASLVETLAEGTESLSRRRLLVGAASAAGVGLTAAALVPIASIGPLRDTDLGASPWAAGLGLVDGDGRPLSADAIAEGGIAEAFPEGGSEVRRQLGAPLSVVRVDPATLALPAGREGWAPEGILAYSRICTHAACAVTLYRSPLYEPQSSPPGLVCPCHYSTFDVRRGCAVVFGPAGRPLPQLPLRIEADRRLVAAGPMSGPVGPAWSGLRRTRGD